MKNFLFLLLFLPFLGCSQQKGSEKDIIINEIFQTTSDSTDNVDSPAFWKGKNGETWIITTAKETDLLIVDNAENGRNIKRIGSSGNGLGQFDRPNGIFVIDDYCFVVERDNHRLQIFHLPDFQPLGIIGDTILIKPYGIYINKVDDKQFDIFITDNYETKDEKIPPNNELNKRVHKFNINLSNKNLHWEYLYAFGDTTNPGALKIVESICGDPQNNNLLIAEEDVSQSSVKVYDFNGKFTGKSFGIGLFKSQVEGIALYDCGNGKGYWIVTDQSENRNKFLFFDRITFEYITSFTAKNTTNTDGIWLTQQAFGKFTKGAFFAVNNDTNVSIFDLANLLNKLNLSCK